MCCQNKCNYSEKKGWTPDKRTTEESGAEDEIREELEIDDFFPP